MAYIGWILIYLGRNRANHESGSFAEYAVAKASVQRKIPDNLSFEEAATLGVAIMTVVRQIQETSSKSVDADRSSRAKECTKASSYHCPQNR